jgi:hypothetical protein
MDGHRGRQPAWSSERVVFPGVRFVLQNQACHPVTCSAQDAVGNTTVDSFTVEVFSPFGYIPDFVALGREWVDLGIDVQIKSGNVGAFDASAGVPSAAAIEVVLGQSSVMGSGSKVATHSARLLSFAAANEDYYVDQADVGTGATHVPKTGYVPLFLDMPAFAAAGPGGPDQTVHDTLALAPGAYGTLDVKPKASVTLTAGGEYTFSEIELGANSSLNFVGLGTAIVRVAGRMRLHNSVTIGGSAPANRFIILVGGSDGPKEPAYAFGGGNGLHLTASVYAANGTLDLGSGAVATGTFLGRRVKIGNQSALTLVGGAFDIIYP